jgi:hypothetical protein
LKLERERVKDKQSVTHKLSNGQKNKKKLEIETVQEEEEESKTITKN